VAGFKDFLKKEAGNTLKGGLGKAFVGFDVANLVVAENKLKAVGQLLKNLILLRLTMATAFAGLFSMMKSGIRSLVTDTGALNAAMDKLRKISAGTRELQNLIGTLKETKRYMGELVKISEKKLVPIEELVAAAKGMKILSQGTMGTVKDLEKMVDLSRATGRGLVETTDAVTQLKRDLQDGKPIDSSADALERMGAMSASSAQKLKTLQETGATLNSQLEFMNSGLDAAAKAGSGFEQSLEGLNQKLAESEELMKSKFGESFLEGERKSTEAAIKLNERLAEILGVVGEALSKVGSAGSGIRDTMLTKLLSLPGVLPATKVLTNTLTAAVTAASALGAISAGKFLYKGGKAAMSSIRGFDATASASNMLTRSVAMREAGATGIRGLAASGLEAGAVGLSKGAAYASRATSGIGGKIGSGLGRVIKGGGYLYLAAEAAMAVNASREREAALKKLKDSNSSMETSMAGQIAAVRSLSDAQKALIDSTNQLTAAREAAADPSGDSRVTGQDNLHVRRSAFLRNEAMNKLMGLSAAPDSDRLARDRRVGEISAQQQLSRATGEDRARLTEAAAEKARMRLFERDTFTKDKKSMAALEIAAASGDQGAIGELGRRRNTSGSSLMRESQALESDRATKGGTPAFAAREARYKEREAYIMGASGEDVAAAEEEARSAKLQSEADERSLATQEKINALKSEGVQRAKDIRLIEEEALDAEIEAAIKSGNKTGAQAMTGQREAAKTAANAADKEEEQASNRADTELKIALLKERGFALAEKESALRRQQLLDELKAIPAGDVEAVKRKQAEIAGLDTDTKLRREERASSDIDQQIELTRQKGQLTGNSKMAQGADDFAAYKEKYDQLIGEGRDPDQAKAIASRFTQNSISLESLSGQSSLNAAAAVSSMARIGGGGGVEAVGGDRLLTATERGNSLLEKIESYTKFLEKSRDMSIQ